MRAMHAWRALRAVTARELVKFARQKGRLASALVRPLLWLLVFAAGFQDVFGVSIIPPYRTYITYQEYVVPGLVGIVLLFNGMLSSLSLVFDRETGMMRLLLTAPLPRWYILLCKLLASTLLSVVQAYCFLIVAALLGIGVSLPDWFIALPAVTVSGLLLSAIGLLLSVYIRQLENFAGTMNFVIFPMFFLSSALYPLWKLRENGSALLYDIAMANPFTHAVEFIRFAAYGRFNAVEMAIVCGGAIFCFLVAVTGYDPQRGLLRRRPQPA